MPSLIKILPDHVINRIAAGEVVERPASVVKELVENSLDAGATEVFIDIEQSGRRLIRISDNGCGMAKSDAQMAFQRHATSKISSDADLDTVRTMGFRGEALSSIAAVSQVRLRTATKDASAGFLIELEGGAVRSAGDAAASQGTLLEVSHLFYNIPARLKFLKSPATEFSHILTTVSRIAMANRSIHFRLTHDKRMILELPPSRNGRDRVFQLYGAEIADQVIEFTGERSGVTVNGFLGRPGYTRADRTYQEFYVNNRPVRNQALSHALYRAHGDMLMRDRHPVAFLFIDVDPSLVDVNVHPAKAEIRFRNQSQIHDAVQDVIREGLRVYAVGVREAAPAHGDRIAEAIAGYLDGQLLQKTQPVFDNQSFSFTHNTSDADLVHAEAVALFPATGFALPLAQIHDSFIVAQTPEGMELIDQHAAHERVLFELLQDQFQAGLIPAQHLLIPVQVELGPTQSTVLAEHLSEIHRLGLLVEDFGSRTFVIKAVPALLAGTDGKQLLLDILDELNAHGSSSRMDDLRDEILSVMACHPAVKVHRRLSREEMEALLKDLSRCRMPHTCPHGRPTIIRFSMDEIRKMFKRM